MIKKIQKNQKGFTLVEVIVVAVIVAVLAAVAIPLYMGYISDSRVDVGNNVAGTLCSACGSTRQQELVIPAGTTVSPVSPAAAAFIVFPNGGNGGINQVTIPNGFTAIITGTAAAGGTTQCFNTAAGATGGVKTYTF